MAADRVGSFERYVKLFNLVAGIILVVGTAFLIGTVVIRSMNGAGDTGEEQGRIELPAGATLVDTAIGDGRIMLTLKDPDNSLFLLLLDPASGRIIRRIDLAAQDRP